MHAENEKAQADLKNMDAELKPWVARYQADETDCQRISIGRTSRSRA